jgi:hypothetical protein
MQERANDWHLETVGVEKRRKVVLDAGREGLAAVGEYSEFSTQGLFRCTACPLSTPAPRGSGGHPAIKILYTWPFNKAKAVVMMDIYCIGAAMPTILKTVLN